MKPRLLAIRAVSSTYALRIIRTAGIWGGVVILALLLIIWLLAYNFSVWWWLAAIPVGVVALLGLIVWIVLRFILKRLQPPMSSAQKEAAKQLVEKIERLLENTATPYPLLAIRLVLDTSLKRKNGLVSEVISDSKGLQIEFNKLTREFKD